LQPLRVCGHGLPFACLVEPPSHFLFQKAGEADLEDVSSGADYIIKNFPINPKKVGIGGSSYGGFMTLAALAFQPDRWAVVRFGACTTHKGGSALN
jgi:dienelactone hydrolase